MGLTTSYTEHLWQRELERFAAGTQPATVEGMGDTTTQPTLDPADLKRLVVDALTTDWSLTVTERAGKRYVELSQRDVLHVAGKIAIRLAEQHAGKVIKEM